MRQVKSYFLKPIPPCDRSFLGSPVIAMKQPSMLVARHPLRKGRASIKCRKRYYSNAIVRRNKYVVRDPGRGVNHHDFDRAVKKHHLHTAKKSCLDKSGFAMAAEIYALSRAPIRTLTRRDRQL